MVYFRSVGWPHYSQNSDNNVRSAKSSLPVQNNSPNFRRLRREAADAGGLLCLADVCIQNNRAAWNFLWKNSDSIQNRPLCSFWKQVTQQGRGFVVRRCCCWPAALRPEALARAVVTRLGQLGGGRETKVWGRSWDRRQRLTQTNCEKRESELEPKGKMPDPCMVTVKAGPQHSRVGLQQKV